MVIYLKPEYENDQASVMQSGQMKPKKSKRDEKLQKEIDRLNIELEYAKREAEREYESGRNYGHDEAMSEVKGDLEDWDFAQKELQEILDNLKYRKREYSMKEIRELIETILN